MHIETAAITNCPLCNSSAFSTVLHGRDFESGTGNYRIERCGACGLRFTNPRPVAESIPELYRQRTTPDFVPDSPLVSRLRAASTQRRLQIVLKKCGAFDSVLDYGCGDGFFARQLLRAAAGAAVTACDFHRTPPDRLKNHPAISYFSYRQHAQIDRRYGLIFCRHVLEHMPDPASHILRMNTLLQNRGAMVLEVPNYHSIWRTLLGRYYSGLYLPRHLIHFDEASLRKMLAGFEVAHVAKTHTPLLGRSFGYFFGTATANISLFGLALFPFQVLADRLLGRSSVLQVIVKKRANRSVRRAGQLPG
jgi:SAM-dependent methyltransferase